MTRVHLTTVGTRTVETTGADLINAARPGDKVTIHVPAGLGRDGIEWRNAIGRVVIKSRGRLALDMGGKFGRPGVATPDNIVALRSKGLS